MEAIRIGLFFRQERPYTAASDRNEYRFVNFFLDKGDGTGYSPRFIFGVPPPGVETHLLSNPLMGWETWAGKRERSPANETKSRLM